ncbi:MAG: Glu-tRNA(Gln) amidotransferase subunit GatD [Candidatus Parvarchaeota archaeon]|nr:Glu-tRNA(Gln) amidotransferase subunit GatD [Candidatus Parvarchaeota archaeon]
MKASIAQLLKSLKLGDSIEVMFNKRIFHGEFIRRDAEKKLVILKLKSGYDVAMGEENVSSMKLISRAPITKLNHGKETPAFSIENSDLTLITTGGTISSKIDYKTGGVSPTVPPEYYFQIAPGLKDYGNVEVNTLMSKLSEDIAPSDWVKMAKAAYDAINRGSKGIIVTTGTDTMHFISSALSFMLNPLSVPVVFTGAQRSLDRGSTDASTNLLLSAIAASKWEGGESVICMHANLNDNYNFLLRGNRTRKMHSERRDAFRPINSMPLSEVHLNGDIIDLSPHRPKSGETVLNTKIDDKVVMLLSYPGMKGAPIQDAVSGGAHGIVIEGTGFGNLPLSDKSMRDALSYANKKSVPVIITTQTVYGPTSTFVYSRLRELSKFKNVIYVGNMLSETAFSKLIFVLGQTRDIEKVRENMLRSVAGEIGDKNELSEFLI